MKLGKVLENALICTNLDNLYYFIEYCLNNKLIDSNHVDYLFYWMNIFKLSKKEIVHDKLKDYIKLFLMNIYDKESFKALIDYFNEIEFNLNKYNILVNSLKYKIEHFYPKIEYINFNNQFYLINNGTFYDLMKNKILLNHINDYKVVDNKIFFISNDLFITYNLKYKKMKVLNYEYPIHFYKDCYLTRRNHTLYLLDYNHKKIDKMKIEKEYNILSDSSGITLYKEDNNDFIIKSFYLNNHEFIRINKDINIQNDLIWSKFVYSLIDYRKINRKDSNKTIMNLIILYLLDHMKLKDITLKEIDYLYYHAEHLLKDIKVLDEIYNHYQFKPSNTIIDKNILYKYIHEEGV